MADEGEFPWSWILGERTQVRNEKTISSSKQISRSGCEGQLNHGKKWPLCGRHRLKTLRLVLLMRSLNERAVGLKEGKTKWRRKAYSSREMFLRQTRLLLGLFVQHIYIYIYTIFLFLLYPPRIAFANCGHKLCKLYLIWNKLVVVVVVLSNREPRSSQSMWFIIILGISHSCSTFCIRILKTEFVLPKLASGSSSSSRSSDLCRFAIVQFVQKFTANQHIEHLSIAEHETGRNLINLRQICNL